MINTAPHTWSPKCCLGTRFSAWSNFVFFSSVILHRTFLLCQSNVIPVPNNALFSIMLIQTSIETTLCTQLSSFPRKIRWAKPVCRFVAIIVKRVTLFILFAGACLRSSKPAEVSATTPLPTTTELPNYVEVLNCTKNDTEKQDCRNKATCQKELNTKDKSFRLICL